MSFETDDIMGDDVLGHGFGVIGAEEVQQAAMTIARAAAGPVAAARLSRGDARPAWRERLAPGVPVPGTKLYALALAPQAGGGIFTAALASIQFLGRPQKPFRGERLVAIVSRNGGAGVVPVGELFVGTDLVQATAGSIPLEAFGANAFGVRMAWPQAEPGIEIRVNATLIGALAGADTIAVSLVVFGQTQA